jgi:hypothetical protein
MRWTAVEPVSWVPCLGSVLRIPYPLPDAKAPPAEMERFNPRSHAFGPGDHHSPARNTKVS